MMSLLRLGQKQMIVTVGYASDSDKMKVTKFENFQNEMGFSKSIVELGCQHA